MGSASKSLALVLVIILTVSLAILPSATLKADLKQNRTLIVPDNFSTILSAIENATNGDTILVRSGTYQENALSINKSISLIGEGSETTTINLNSGGHTVTIDPLDKVKLFLYDPVIRAEGADFKLSGFTISSTGGKISIAANGTQITNNKITNIFEASGYYLNIADNSFFRDSSIFADYSRICSNSFFDSNGDNGIDLGGHYSIITNNIMPNTGVHMGASSCFISGNKITDSTYPFIVVGDSNVIQGNTINHIAYGLRLEGSNNIILKNQITRCGEGLNPVANNTYYANYIANNGWGINTNYVPINPSGNSSVFFHNNFVNNLYGVCTIVNNNQADFFDNCKEGNYWTDYHGKDANGDGIGDTPYMIDDNRSDRYPLIAPFNISAVPDLIPDWTLPPNLQLLNPTQTTYASENLTLEYTIDKKPIWIGYSLDGLDNVTIDANTTLTSLTAGTHNITVYAKDYYQNAVSTATITFTVIEPFLTVPVIVGSTVSAALVAVGLTVYFKKYKH